MVLKEYRICMPMTLEEYRRGQLYMINRHSDEQSDNGEGVEVITNEACHDEEYGNGQFTEKRIHLNKRLPSWAVSFFPSIYVTEKAWNYYPYTITEYKCPWLERLHIYIETRYENNNGSTDNFSNCKMRTRVQEPVFQQREIVHLDIAYDKIPDKHYKESEVHCKDMFNFECNCTCVKIDCTKFKSSKTGRGPLKKDWKDTHQPIMCSYKLVDVKFEVWGMQAKVEKYIHKVVKDILLLGHRQAFAWIDIWYDMTFENIRDYENEIQNATNEKVRSASTAPEGSASCRQTPEAANVPGTSKHRNKSTP